MNVGVNAWCRRALAALLLGQAVSVLAAPGCDTLEPVPWRALAPGAWVWLPPDDGDVSPANAGHVLPTSVLVSGRQALVIDPGPSHRHGERVRRSLACRWIAVVAANRARATEALVISTSAESTISRAIARRGGAWTACRLMGSGNSWSEPCHSAIQA